MDSYMEIHRLAELFTQQTNRALFITGKAGTGKTTFLRSLRERTNRQIAIVAPTGVAAINAGGTTMHSFFQLPFTPFVPTPEGRRNLVSKQQMRSARRKVLQEVEVIVIDEISMVRADVLDAVDTILRHVRYRPYEPFGGVQMVYIGDLYQLSPVAQAEEWSLLSEYYPSPYFFHSRVIQEQPPLYIEFEKIFRQTNQEFINLLNEVRNDTLSESSFRLLQSRYRPHFKPSQEENYITLTTHNAKADQINAEELNKIGQKSYFFKAEVKGDFPERNYPADANLELKQGAKVMFLSNDMETPRRYYNGKIGEVEELDDERIVVRDENDERIPVSRETWKNISYTVDKKTNRIEETELGSFTQYPLRLAWAITIHKSQGLTFDRAIIDAGASFAPGQVYVALSRCRTLEGIVLLSRISPFTLSTDREVKNYSQAKPEFTALIDEYHLAHAQYELKILLSLFDFQSMTGDIVRLVRYVDENRSEFNDEATGFVAQTEAQVRELQSVGTKFQQQLIALSKQPDATERTTQRVTAACDYFVGKLDELQSHITRMPIITDSKKLSSELNAELKNLFTNVAQKCYLMAGCRTDFSTEHYYAVRNRFTAPSFTLSSYSASRTPSDNPVDIPHPSLYKKLAALRNQLCEDLDVPVYMVCGGKSLIEMCRYLPAVPDELIHVSGFGKVKIQNFGERFTDLIRAYREANGITDEMVEKPPKPGTKRRERKEKTETAEPKPEKVSGLHQTLGLYRAGMDPAEIAIQISRAASTVEGYLVKLVKQGDLSIRDFLTEEEIKQIAPRLLQGDSLSAVYNYFSGQYSFMQLRMVSNSLSISPH